MTPKNNIVIGLIVALLVIASYNIDANPLDFAEGIPNLAIILEEMVAVEPKYIPTALWAMFETIQMAFIGTVVGVV
ncbi:MAG: phosphonate ABC transporter, permease protein PhnE, partial [Thaumarchaeota archaeon]